MIILLVVGMGVSAPVAGRVWSAASGGAGPAKAGARNFRIVVTVAILALVPMNFAVIIME